MRELLEDIRYGLLVGVPVALVLSLVLGIGGFYGYRTWYVSTHCTTVLGTQVCQ